MFTFLPFYLALTFQARAQRDLINALNTKLIEVETLQPNESFARFDEFSKALGNTKIIGLGESTHGTKEFTYFRGTLIKHLVTKLAYKAITLEADFSGALALNNYILYGKGKKNDCLYKLGVWIWNNQEFSNLVEWLRNYNLSQPDANKVKIYGCDMQLPDISKQIIDKSFQLKTPLDPEAEQALDLVCNWKEEYLKKPEILIMKKLASALNEEISQYPDTSVVRQSIKTIIQHINLRLTDNWYKRAKIRDQIMAENIDWVYENAPDHKVIFMGHNTHISKQPFYDDIKRAGGYLKDKYKNAYYALGASFYSGDFRAMDEKTHQLTVFSIPELESKESSEFVFSQCKVPNFILDFDLSMDHKDIDMFLRKKTYAKNIGASYRKSERDLKPIYMPLTDKFDGVFFFKKTLAISPQLE